MATMSGLAPPAVDDGVGEGLGVAGGHRRRRAGDRVEDGGVVEALLVVVLGRLVAPALLGEDVDEDGLVELGRPAQGVLEQRDVVAVDGADVAHAQGLEEAAGAQDLPGRGPHALQAELEVLADAGHAPQHPLDAVPALDVGRVQPQPGEAGGQPGDRGGVGPAVVVEDDQDPPAAVAEVVERLVGHAAGHGAVADHGHHPAVGLVLEVHGHGQAVGVAQDGGGVAVLDPVVGRLGPRRVARRGRWPGAGWRSAPGARSGSCGRTPGGRCPTGAGPWASRTPGAGRG